MTMRIVHLGQGRTAETSSADFVDPTVSAPRFVIPPKRLETLRRLKPAFAPALKEGPVRYVSGPLLAMRKGQCRYPITDDAFCGARTIDGKSWCRHHDGLVHGRVVVEAAE